MSDFKNFPTFVKQADIAFGAIATSTKQNSLKAANDNFIEPLSLYTTVTRNASAVGIAATEWVNYCNATSGAQIHPLPNASTTTNAIFIQKTDSSNNSVTVQRTGTDTIQDYIGGGGVNSIVLPTKDSYVKLLSDGSTWRVVDINIRTNRLSVSAYQTASGTFTAGSFLPVSFQTENHDFNSNFATTTYTVPVSGFYDIGGQVTFNNGVSGYYDVFLYKNGANVRDMGAFRSSNTSDFPKMPFYTTIQLVAGDLVQIQARASATTNSFAGQTTTYLTIDFKHF